MRHARRTLIAVQDDSLTRELERALAEHDPELLGELLATARTLGLARQWAPVFAKLLGERWHRDQEDLASALQDLREPATSDALFAVACDSAPFDATDDGRALARKCVWALHDIGARDHLARLAATAKDPETRGHAERKLADLMARAPDAPPAAYRVARDRKVRR